MPFPTLPSDRSAFFAVLLASCVLAQTASSHGVASFEREPGDERAITFPDTADYLTLVLDPHTHSVFSDGHVWPSIRVQEALRDGLDALAITEHLEWLPHLQDIPHDDRNRAWEEAKLTASESDLIVINGSEISRRQPVGHINALFLTDANALVREPADAPRDDVRGFSMALGAWPAENALREARRQGAFVFINHLDWTVQKRSGIAELTDFHHSMIAADMIHGVEVANTFNYSEDAFAIALEHDLTILGSSDIHELIDWDYPPSEGRHRPVTLVLAEARTEESIQEALFARRAVAWLDNLLIGRPEHIQPIIDASIEIESAYYRPGTVVLSISVRNHSDATFQLQNESSYTFTRFGEIIELEPHETTTIEVRTVDVLEDFDIPFQLLNVLVAPKQHPDFRLSGSVGQAPLDP